jgi:hypothetical protein
MSQQVGAGGVVIQGRARRVATGAPAYDPFLLLLRAHGLPAPETEVVFAPPRKYRADYLWRAARVIVEQNGGVWTIGGHSSGRGILRDYAKSNLAQLEGWMYLVYTPQQLRDGRALADLRTVLV